MNPFGFLSIPIAVLGGIMLATRTKKSKDLTYTSFDRMCFFLNLVLIPIYFVLMLQCVFLGLVSIPIHKGPESVSGWIVSTLISLAPSLCGIGLGLSVEFRRSGKSKASFITQFLGLIGIVLALFLYNVFSNELIQALN